MNLFPLFLLHFMLHYALSSEIAEAKEDSVLEENVEILFGDDNEIKMTFLVKNLGKHTEKNISLALKLDSILSQNLTINEVKKSYIEILENDEENIVLEDGRRVPLGATPTKLIVLTDASGKNSLFLNLDRFMNMTMKDIEGDSNLIPLPFADSKDIQRSLVNIRDINVSMNATAVNISLNNQNETSYSVDYLSGNKSMHVRGEGLLFLVLNPFTGCIVYEAVMLTGEFGGYHDFIWTLQMIHPGRLIFLISLRDGANFLDFHSRLLLEKSGIKWPWTYMYRDAWLIMFFKGGKSLGEIIIPNMRGFNTTGNSAKLHIDFKNIPENIHTSGCRKWPATTSFNARKQFCDEHDGFGSLCSCENPFVLKTPPSTRNESAEIPIIIIAGNRTEHLFRLLMSLNKQPLVHKKMILLVSDGQIPKTSKFIEILDLNLLIHRPEGFNASRISRVIRFSLYNGLLMYPAAKSFIVLEDDLYLSTDFYSYMKQLEPIFELDESIYCVNAFNHLSYPHTSNDPSLTYRTNSCPAYGWMMSRNIIKQILPRWLPASRVHDWDYFVGSFLVRGTRECIIPDINRSYHWSSGGMHAGSLWKAEKLYLSRNVNTQADVLINPVERMVLKNYEIELTNRIEEAIPISIKEQEDYDILENSNKSYVIFVKTENISDDLAVMLVGNDLGIWIMDGREHHNYCWWLHYRKAEIFIIGVPLSNYSRFMPENYPVFKGTKQDRVDIRNGEFWDWNMKAFPVRKNASELPSIFD